MSRRGKDTGFSGPERGKEDSAGSMQDRRFHPLSGLSFCLSVE